MGTKEGKLLGKAGACALYADTLARILAGRSWVPFLPVCYGLEGLIWVSPGNHAAFAMAGGIEHLTQVVIGATQRRAWRLLAVASRCVYLGTLGADASLCALFSDAGTFQAVQRGIIAGAGSSGGGEGPDASSTRPTRSGKGPDASSTRPTRSGEGPDACSTRPTRSGKGPDASSSRPSRSHHVGSGQCMTLDPRGGASADQRREDAMPTPSADQRRGDPHDADPSAGADPQEDATSPEWGMGPFSTEPSMDPFSTEARLGACGTSCSALHGLQQLASVCGHDARCAHVRQLGIHPALLPALGACLRHAVALGMDALSLVLDACRAITSATESNTYPDLGHGTTEPRDPHRDSRATRQGGPGRTPGYGDGSGGVAVAIPPGMCADLVAACAMATSPEYKSEILTQDSSWALAVYTCQSVQNICSGGPAGIAGQLRGACPHVADMLRVAAAGRYPTVEYWACMAISMLAKDAVNRAWFIEAGLVEGTLETIRQGLQRHEALVGGGSGALPGGGTGGLTVGVTGTPDRATSALIGTRGPSGSHTVERGSDCQPDKRMSDSYGRCRGVAGDRAEVELQIMDCLTVANLVLLNLVSVGEGMARLAEMPKDATCQLLVRLLKLMLAHGGRIGMACVVDARHLATLVCVWPGLIKAHFAFRKHFMAAGAKEPLSQALAVAESRGDNQTADFVRFVRQEVTRKLWSARAQPCHGFHL
eukprot:jgi/Mesvir1/24858/Mv22092-RA.2